MTVSDVFFDGLSFMNPSNRLVKIESEEFSAPAALKKTLVISLNAPILGSEKLAGQSQ